MKKVDYRHIICIIITLGVVALGVFRFFDSIGRIIEACRDFGLSIAYYFCELFMMPHNIIPTVNDYANYDLIYNPFGGISPSISLPDSWEGFKVKWGEYWQAFASKENLDGYFAWLGDFLYAFSLVILICLPLVIILILVSRKLLNKQNNDWGEDTGPLKLFKAAANHTYRPAKEWLADFSHFVAEHKAYWGIWLALFALYFNIATIFIEFLAFYFYFVVSFDFVSIYRQVY